MQSPFVNRSHTDLKVEVSFLIFIQRKFSLFKRYIYIVTGGARGVMVIVVGTGHGDTSSNPGQDIALIPLGKV